MPLTSRPGLSSTLSPANDFWTHIYDQRASAITSSQLSSLAASDANVRAWENEIASLRTVLVAAIRQCNACSITHMLPTEILARIFEELVSIFPIDTHAKTSINRRGWLPIVQVCQHWRNVARAHSTLWQRVTYASKPLWDLFMESAGDIPLTVTGCVFAHHPSSEKFLDLIPAHLHRMKELCVHAQTSVEFGDRAAHTRFVALMRSLNTSREPLDRLEVLSLKPTGYSGRGLRAEFMKRPLPKLRQVSLQRISLPLGIYSQSITSLELIETFCRNPGEVLKPLEHLTCLEDLTLNRSSDGSHTTPAPPIELPHVRRLVVKNSLAICTAYLKSMVIHPLAYIEIDAGDTSHLHDEDLSELGAALFTSKQFELTNLELSVHELRTTCDVAAWGDEGEGGTYGPTLSNQPTTSHPHPWPGIKATLPIPIPLIEFDSPCAISPVIMVDFLSQVPKATWNVVTLRGHMHWDTEQILSLFSAAESLDTLVVDDVPTDTIFALCASLNLMPSLETPSPILPMLTSLHFANIDFGCPSEDCNAEDSAIPYVRDVLLHFKCRRGKVLETLSLNSCSIAEEYVEEWESYVMEVDWDGHIGDAHDRHTDSEHDEDEDNLEDDGEVSDAEENAHFMDDLD